MNSRGLDITARSLLTAQCPFAHYNSSVDLQLYVSVLCVVENKNVFINYDYVFYSTATYGGQSLLYNGSVQLTLKSTKD